MKLISDADTQTYMIDGGFGVKTKQKIRLRGIDCPELSTKEGRYAKQYVIRILEAQKFVILKTYKDDKYDRMLADVFYLPKEQNPAVVAQKGIFLNQ